MKRRSDRRNLSKKIKEGGEGQKKERQGGGGFKEKVKVQRQMEEKIDMRFMHGEE